MKWLKCLKAWLTTPFTDGPVDRTEEKRKEVTVRTRSFRVASDAAKQLGKTLKGTQTYGTKTTSPFPRPNALHRNDMDF